MRLSRLCLLSSVAILALAINSLGDALGHHPRPRPNPSPGASDKVRMIIQISPDAKGATLQIPRGMLQGFLATTADIGNEGDQAEGHAGSRTRTIVAGILLSFSFALGGLWYWRFRPRASLGEIAGDTGQTGQIVSLIGAGFVVCMASSLALADLRDPGPVGSGAGGESRLLLVCVGLLLFLAFALCGIYLFRSRRRKRSHLALALAVLAAVGCLAAVSRADLRAQRRPAPPDLRLALPNGGPVTGLVKVVVVPEGDHLTLTVQPDPSK
jgi:hypothetical protein